MILFHVKPGGAVTVTPTGYPGGECQRVTAPYTARLLGKTTKDVPTSEAHEPERETNRQERELA